MEALEQQAFEALCKQLKKQPDKGLKRPAAAKAKAKTMPAKAVLVSKAKAVPVSKAAAKEKAAGTKPCGLKNLRGTSQILGCPRCGGNWRDLCQSFVPWHHAGWKSAWKSYMERKQGGKKQR